MNKADYKFHKNRQREIKHTQSQTEPALFYFAEPANRPIYIPKRKKKK